MITKMKYGARKGKMNLWRRWFAKAASQELVIFPVPGADFLRQYQDEPMGKKARLSVSPRDANVLLIVGDLNTKLAEHAATVYVQMPRPRVLVMAGPEHLEPLPHPDVHTALEKGFLGPALEAARKCLADFGWNEEAEPYRPETLVKEMEKAAQQKGHMHDHGAHGDHGHGEHDHGHEGHDHSAHQHDKADGEHNHNQGNHKYHDHSHSDDAEAIDRKDCHEAPDKSSHDHETDEHDHSQHGHEGHDHDSHQHGSHSAQKEHQQHGHGGHHHANDDHKHQDHDDTQQEEHGHCHSPEHSGHQEGHDHGSHDPDHSGHNHGSHEHDHSQHGGHGHDHGSGFMSMIAMTKDLPRSRDGLPMEWSDVQFGPFHQGLPGGLRLSIKLDGDTVAEAEVDLELPNRNLQASVPDNPAKLPEYLEGINPIAPINYRLLAHKALASFLEDTAHIQLTLDEAVLLEKERVISHLNWLAVFSTALGSDWMRNQATEHYHHFQNGNGNREQLFLFMERIKKLPYLKIKLSAASLHHLESEDNSHTHEDHDHSQQGEHDHGHEGDYSAHNHSDHGEHKGHDHSADQQGNAGGGHNHNHEDHEDHDPASQRQEGQESEHDSFTGLLKDEITGPAARAAGLRKDARLHEEIYQETGWSPATASGNDAWSRLLVRLDEISHSLRFIEKAKSKLESEVVMRQAAVTKFEGSGEGIARIESPRGQVSVRIHIHEGKLVHMHLTTPSSALVKMTKFVTQQQELSDALIAVSSLDISSWEINP